MFTQKEEKVSTALPSVVNKPAAPMGHKSIISPEDNPLREDSDTTSSDEEVECDLPPKLERSHSFTNTVNQDVSPLASSSPTPLDMPSPFTSISSPSSAQTPNFQNGMTVTVDVKQDDDSDDEKADKEDKHRPSRCEQISLKVNSFATRHAKFIQLGGAFMGGFTGYFASYNFMGEVMNLIYKIPNLSFSSSTFQYVGIPFGIIGGIFQASVNYLGIGESLLYPQKMDERLALQDKKVNEAVSLSNEANKKYKKFKITTRQKMEELNQRFQVLALKQNETEQQYQRLLQEQELRHQREIRSLELRYNFTSDYKIPTYASKAKIPPMFPLGVSSFFNKKFSKSTSAFSPPVPLLRKNAARGPIPQSFSQSEIKDDSHHETIGRNGFKRKDTF